MRQTKSNARQNVTKHLGARTIKIPINNVKKLTGIGFLPASEAPRKTYMANRKKYGLYFSPFQIAEKQCLEKGSKNTGQIAEIRPEYVAYSACCEREMLILLLCRLFLPRKSFLFCHRPRSCLF